MIPLSFQLEELVRSALSEDIGWGDLTTDALFPDPVPSEATLYPKEEIILAGTVIVSQIFRILDPDLRIRIIKEDGCRIRKGQPFLTLRGDGRSILKGERIALNFLQRLSGIATYTAQFVRRVEGTGTRILDTRKTTPGMRILERYAVRMGGGENHRFHLGDAFLIKDNHLALGGGVARTLKRLRDGGHSISSPVEIEAKTIEEVKAALKGGADRILLDNMTLPRIKKALSLIRDRAVTEVSGGVTLSNVREIALTGVGYISIGALTHSARSVDITLDLARR